MITHTIDFDNLMKQPEKTVRVRTYDYSPEDEAQEPTIVWANDLKNLSVDSVGHFLGAGSRSATAVIFGDQSPMLGASIRLDLEVLKPDNTWETITLGNFSVYQVEYDVETTLSKVTLHDGMMMLSTTEYTLTDEQFPITVHGLAQEMADYIDVQLDPNFGNLPNASYEIIENLWATIQNTNYRDVVSQIAEATGTTAVVSNGQLLFKQFGEPTSQLNETNLLRFKMGQGWGKVNSVSLSRMPQNDNIVLSNEADTETHGTIEAVIINNQIVDDDRTTLIQPLYDALVTDTPYISFYDAEFKTEGHGWYEIGDVITSTLSETDYPIFVTEHHLYIGPESFTETLKSVTPTNPAVNKTSAGGILRSLWNTELKVDKQNNEIISVVSRQDEYETETEQNFTEVRQDVNNITSSIQDGGGMNQIKNSVGYSVEDGQLNFWDADGVIATSRTDTSAFTAGAISGSTVDLLGAGTFTQRVTVNPGGSYVVSFYARKETQGTVTVSASNDLDHFEVVFDDDTTYEWGKYRINDIVPTSNYLDITFTLDADVTAFSFTDLAMVRGIADRGWYQAVGEVSNTNITLDTTGITVRSNVYEGAYTRMTPIEFAGYDTRGQRAFAVNNDTTEVNNLEIDGNIDTPEVLIVSLSSGPNAGMNFVVKG